MIWTTAQFRKFRSKFRFPSKPEAICALSLISYVPDFEIVKGETWQVPVTKRGAVDFVILDDVVIEYHPISLQREFLNSQSYRRLMDTFRRIKREHRATIRTILEDELRDRYYKTRRFLLDASPDLCKYQLIVCTSPNEFYKRVLKPYGKRIPDIKEFYRTFRKLDGTW